MTRVSRMALALILVAALGLGACGGDDSEIRAGADDTTTVEPGDPAQSAPGSPGPEDPTEVDAGAPAPDDTAVPGLPDPPAQDVLDAAYLGLSEDAAIAAATAAGVPSRVVARDGENFAVTADYSPQRVNFTVVDGLVTEVSAG